MGVGWRRKEGREEGVRWGRQRPIWVRSGRTTAKAGAAARRLPREGGGEMKRGCNEKKTQRESERKRKQREKKYKEAGDESEDRK